MRPGSVFNWHDQSGVKREITARPVMPLMLSAFTSDKGPEGLRTVYGENFYKLYGSDISFEKHGQPLLQAANIINAGGELLAYRVAAPDSTLANAIIVAKVKQEQVQKVNANGEPLYTDKVTQAETTTAEGNEAIMINTASIKYEVMTVPNVKDMAAVEKQARAKLDAEGAEGTFTYPLFVITDNGRGTSSKRFNITPDYNISKNLNFQIYKINHLGDSALDTEYTRFSVVPDKIYLGKSMSLTMSSKELMQTNAKELEDITAAFIKKISTFTGIAEATLVKYDILFGKTVKGESVPQIKVDSSGYALNSDLGITLQSGTNGAFGDRPFIAETYADELVKVFNGTYDDTIYDLDRYKIDVFVDANYPVAVKNAVTKLADFRQDFTVLRDLGLNTDSYDTILLEADKLNKSRYAADYLTTYDIIDPFRKKQINVTILYDMAAAIVPHLNERRNCPVCGILYGMVFPNAIESTVNFTPKITPTVDQKTALGDLRLNYASYLNGVLTLETEFTSQTDYTQLSFINNVLAIQEVIHDVRNKCPAFRYSFITSDDLETYRKNVEEIINQYKDNFASIEFEYVQDEVMAANKIFEASIKVVFKDFVQSEIFNIYTLSAN